MPGSLITRARGLLRSLLIYYGMPWRAARLRAFYAQFVPRGGLAFDIGAHVGNRIRAWRALGAHVVAVEPHPDLLRILRLLYGRDEAVTIVAAAVGGGEGEARLLVDHGNLTVTTLSPEWVREVAEDAGFRNTRWQPGQQVAVTTLQALIAAHGVPDFVKIDVEGLEAEVLSGLGTALPCLSFEYLPAARARALACIAHLESLGAYRFNWSVGESHRLALTEWCTAAAVRAFVVGLAADDGSGDIYARLQQPRR
jgi:FkbM family methyltransferase